jgi:hypothetical protein
MRVLLLADDDDDDDDDVDDLNASFLDDNDKKMVLVRETRRTVELAQCGIEPTRLFALYDQIHTTGNPNPRALGSCRFLICGG